MNFKLFGTIVCCICLSVMIELFVSNIIIHDIRHTLEEAAIVGMVKNMEIERSTEDYYLDQEGFKAKFESNFLKYSNPNFEYSFSYNLNSLGASIVVTSTTPLGEVNVPITVIYDEKDEPTESRTEEKGGNDDVTDTE